MKIIKHGDKVSHRFTCCKCGCEFEAFDREFTYHPARKYIGGINNEYTIWDYYESYCPECGERCCNY